MLEDRCSSAMEGLIFALFTAGAFFIFAVFARVVFKKKIDSPRYYTIAIVSGFLLHRALVTVSPSESQNGVVARPGQQSSSSSAQSGLDAPFIPPTEENLESFPAQLDRATTQLAAKEREQLSNAIAFLVFSFGAHLADQDLTQLDDAEDLDFAAKSLIRLYRFAQKQSHSMTLRKYVDLADEMKRQKPEWWAEFQEVQALEKASPKP